MHVHVCRGVDKFRNTDLAEICKALCYFEDAITKVMPADRKENIWAVSNVLGHPTKGSAVNQKLKRRYGSVPKNSWQPFFEYLDKVSVNTVHDMLSSRNRYVSWNFENVKEHCGTVEFRRPPGVKTAKEASHWAAFTVGFIAQAMIVDWSKYAKLREVGPVHELQAFILGGTQVLGPYCYGALQKERIVEHDSEPTALSATELEAVERKMKDKDQTKSHFVEKVIDIPTQSTLVYLRCRIKADTVSRQILDQTLRFWHTGNRRRSSK